MSAILSADDLNDFITPGVACIKPVETLPRQRDSENPYEVTTEDQAAQQDLPPAQISLTDCLACSGCVTSAEAVLVSLQSHAEVLRALDSAPEVRFSDAGTIIHGDGVGADEQATPKVFVASVSPQVRASLAATYGITQRQAGHLIEQFLSGSNGLRAGGQYGNGFTWVVDTNVARDISLKLTVDEVAASLQQSRIGTVRASDGIPQQPVLASACPGWICYAEKTHPHVLPHMSRVKSPQALMGTLLKSALAQTLNIPPSQIWHLAIMPCFDKKLEASRAELTNLTWSGKPEGEPIRDVDCVITPRELLQLADTRGIDLRALPKEPLTPQYRTHFPDSRLASFLFPKFPYTPHGAQSLDAGTSGGYLHHFLRSRQSSQPGTQIRTQRGRNPDVVEYCLVDSEGKTLIKAARYYGFRNIQNLVRKLKPARSSRLLGAAGRSVTSSSSASSSASSLASIATTQRTVRPTAAGAANSLSQYAYVEVMACPGGCTNGGGQIRSEDVQSIQPAPPLEGSSAEQQPGMQVRATPKPSEQRAHLARVDAAYYESGSVEEVGSGGDDTADPDGPDLDGIMSYWSDLTGVPLSKLTTTTYHEVESDVGKSKGKGETARVAELAGKIGGGW